MEFDSKSKEGRRGKNRRRGGGKSKEEKYEREVEETANSEILSSRRYSADLANKNVQETSLDLVIADDGGEDSQSSSFMCPALRRQLQTHKNILRLLHENKLVSTQINGQRILSIQPIRWSGPTPGIECEIFVGRIPKTIYEDTLYPLFKLVGEVFQIRLMVDMAELTRGYCFIMYTKPEDAARAIVQLDQYEISPGKKIRVLASVNNCKLYVGPLPWNIASEEVVRVMYASAWDIQYVSIYRYFNHNAAYAIVSFRSHRNAALARRKLRPERLFKCNEVHVEWAHVDWNSSTNVYEDRGTVDDKGDVQISRNYLQLKRLADAPTQKNSNHGKKKPISPIGPPNNINNNNNNKNAQANSSQSYGKLTRYSTMMTMAAALDDYSFDLYDQKSFEMLTDVNGNAQLPNECGSVFEGEAQWRKGATTDFPSFDMWNSNLVPQLPGSSTNPSSLEDYESSEEAPIAMPCDSVTKAQQHLPSRIPYLNGFQRPSSDVGGFDRCKLLRDHSFNSDAMAADAARYHAPLPVHHQNTPVSPYYVLLHSDSNYLYAESAMINNHVRTDYYRDETSAPPSAIYERPSCFCGGRIPKLADDWNPAVPKVENRVPIDFLPNGVSAVRPMYAPSLERSSLFGVAPEDAPSRFVPFNLMTSEKRPRAILKRVVGDTQQ